MELHQVRYFVAVSRLLNFTRAAEQCNVTQPALTKAIQKLEFELGGELIHRERQLTQLTDLGKLVLPTLERLVAAVDSARSIAREYQRKDNAPLKIGLTPCVSSNLLVAPLAEIARHVPGIQVEIREEPTSRLLELLFDGEISAAIAADATELPERIDHWDLFEDHFVLLTAGTNPLAEIDRVPMSALTDAVWLERTGCDLTRKFRDIISANGKSPKISHRSRHENHLQHMVEAGLGIMVASAHMPRLPTLGARPILDDPMRWTVSLLVIAGRRYTPALDAFIKVARLRDWRAESTEALTQQANEAKIVVRKKSSMTPDLIEGPGPTPRRESKRAAPTNGS
jgi:DNA-binding transcriptional LysR family regulator